MLAHILISLLVGLIAYWLIEAIAHNHNAAVVVGIVVGVLVYLGALSL